MLNWWMWKCVQDGGWYDSTMFPYVREESRYDQSCNFRLQDCLSRRKVGQFLQHTTHCEISLSAPQYLLWTVSNELTLSSSFYYVLQSLPRSCREHFEAHSQLLTQDVGLIRKMTLNQYLLSWISGDDLEIFTLRWYRGGGESRCRSGHRS